MALFDRFKNAVNAFASRDPTPLGSYASTYIDYGAGYSERPDMANRSIYQEIDMITSIYNRIALDAADISIRHVQKDEEGNYQEDVDSGLNECLTVEANLDQSYRDFIKDMVVSMMDEGDIAVCPILTDKDPETREVVDIYTLRVGKIVQWYPKHVRVDLYDEESGNHKELVFQKSSVAILTNPMKSIMNDKNSTIRRLKRKLAILDAVDEKVGSDKLNMIIQLPYSVKTKVRQEQVEERKKDIEMQLTENKFGIAYIDSTEKIIQLNRPLENNLQTQIEYLYKTAMTQLYMTEEILNGSANQETMTNYSSRTVKPYLDAIRDEFRRKFISRTGRAQGKDIMYFRDPIALVPASGIADIADTFTRNEIMTANEIRQKIGMKPSKDPRADELRNKNISQSAEAEAAEYQNYEGEEGDYQNEE